MKLRNIAALVIVLFGCEQAAADEDRWVKVTRPMLACEVADDDGLLRQQFLGFLASMPEAAPLPAKCRRVLQVGAIFVLDSTQTEADTQLLVKMREGYCLEGTAPKRQVYAPPRRMVGAYLRPISPPQECGHSDEGSADQ
jgi:hypothetical protein